ncbi:MAG: hypothetical protein M3486_01065 [Actinomycetota bacterium]|nr:hypothetical protein [Actinomycetota bacterium]
MTAPADAPAVVVLDYPSNGIQNGDPDGMALVVVAGGVVEFLSYEGAFTAVGGWWAPPESSKGPTCAADRAGPSRT